MNEKKDRNQAVIEQLCQAIESYLKRRPHMSLNGIAKRCNVSEPTLRRIMARKVKTLPQVTTLLDILTYVSDTQSIQSLIRQYPGPIADFLSEGLPQINEIDQEYSNEINRLLGDPTRYLIFKLSLNHSGVRLSKIEEMFGRHGLKLLREMIEAGHIREENGGLCRAQVGTYYGSHDLFVRQFKAVADYIKPQSHQNRRPLNPLFVNWSDSINAKAYEQIVRLQRATQKKIAKILTSSEAKGELPVFFLCAIDTLDFRGAFELEEEIQAQDRRQARRPVSDH